MAHIEVPLMRLNKEGLVRVSFRFAKLEVHIHFFRNINSKHSDRLVKVEERWYVNEHYSRNKCLEISGILVSVKDRDL